MVKTIIDNDGVCHEVPRLLGRGSPAWVMTKCNKVVTLANGVRVSENGAEVVTCLKCTGDTEEWLALAADS